jgi:hypothetical protein
MAEVIIEKFRPSHGACLYMSALLVAMINDHLRIKAKFVTGSLSVEGVTIFSHSPIKENISQNENYISSWDGHAWVYVPGFIIDLSIFQTIYSRITPVQIQNIFSKQFNHNVNYLIGQESKLIKMGFCYTEFEVLNDDHATLFINNVHRLGLINS